MLASAVAAFEVGLNFGAAVIFSTTPPSVRYLYADDPFRKP